MDAILSQGTFGRLLRAALWRLLPTNRLGDSLFARVDFYLRHGRRPGVPGIFSDELFKVRTREALDPLRVFVSDKELLKLYVAGCVGEAHNVPTIAVLRSRDEVDQFVFPQRCVIKPTHASGAVIIRRNGEPLDLKKIRSWFDLDIYRKTRESNYKSLSHKIIVEPLIFERDDNVDYKFFCRNGVPRMIQVDVDRFTDHRRCLYDTDWNLQPYSLRYPRYDAGVQRPANLPDMLRVAGRLSQGFGLVRIDLYSNGQECLVGEVTNCHGGGTERFVPPEAEKDASRLIFAN